MRTFLLFFAWPGGAVWGNVWAMPLCGAVAAVSAFLLRDRLGSAMRGWWHRHLGHGAELGQIQATLDKHADLLDLTTPGGLAAVLKEVRDSRVEAKALMSSLEARLRETGKEPGKPLHRPEAGGPGTARRKTPPIRM